MPSVNPRSEAGSLRDTLRLAVLVAHVRLLRRVLRRARNELAGAVEVHAAAGDIDKAVVVLAMASDCTDALEATDPLRSR